MSFLDDNEGPVPTPPPTPPPPPPPEATEPEDPFEDLPKLAKVFGRYVFRMVLDNPLPIVFGAALGTTLGAWATLAAAMMWLFRMALEDLHDFD